MSDDKITISREQWEKWRKESFDLQKISSDYKAIYSPDFDALKAFVEKPKRREFWVFKHECNVTPTAYASEQPGSTLVREVLPDDLPPMTKGEMRELLQKVSDGARPEAFPVTTFHMRILKALGIEE